jgi:putative transposase
MLGARGSARFVHWYNQEHHSGIRYVTPAQRHAGQDRSLLDARHAIYQDARERNPRRWSGQTRNWQPIGVVSLNPERDTVVLAATSQKPTFDTPLSTPTKTRNQLCGES